MLDENVPIEEILKWPELADVRKELEDPRYANRQHGSRATYALGCHEVLCKTSERVRARRRRMKYALRAGRDLEEVVERFGDRTGDPREELLIAIIEWHKKTLILGRLEHRRLEAS